MKESKSNCGCICDAEDIAYTSAKFYYKFANEIKRFVDFVIQMYNEMIVEILKTIELTLKEENRSYTNYKNYDSSKLNDVCIDIFNNPLYEVDTEMLSTIVHRKNLRYILINYIRDIYKQLLY